MHNQVVAAWFPLRDQFKSLKNKNLYKFLPEKEEISNNCQSLPIFHLNLLARCIPLWCKIYFINFLVKSAGSFTCLHLTSPWASSQIFPPAMAAVVRSSVISPNILLEIAEVSSLPSRHHLRLSTSTHPLRPLWARYAASRLRHGPTATMGRCLGAASAPQPKGNPATAVSTCPLSSPRSSALLEYNPVYLQKASARPPGLPFSRLNI